MWKTIFIVISVICAISCAPQAPAAAEKAEPVNEFIETT